VCVSVCMCGVFGVYVCVLTVHHVDKPIVRRVVGHPVNLAATNSQPGSRGLSNSPKWVSLSWIANLIHAKLADSQTTSSIDFRLPKAQSGTTQQSR
jgi:hypothetical protein